MVELNEKSADLLKRMKRQVDLSEDLQEIPKSELVSVKEALTTQDANILMPKVLTGMMREAAEPSYVGSNLLKKVRLTDGRSVIIPSMGAMRAHEIGETQSYPEETVDFQLHKSQEVVAKKYGLSVSVSDEMINESQWDVIGILVRKAGEAMARLKEENAFTQFSNHGNLVFDNDMREKNNK